MCLGGLLAGRWVQGVFMVMVIILQRVFRRTFFVAVSGVGAVLTSALSMGRSRVSTSAGVTASLNTSDLSIIRVLVSVRSRFSVRVPSDRVRGVRAISRLIRCVRGGSWVGLGVAHLLVYASGDIWLLKYVSLLGNKFSFCLRGRSVWFPVTSLVVYATTSLPSASLATISLFSEFLWALGG